MSTAETPTIRLYHLAQEWEIQPAELVGLLRAGGLEVASHFTEFQRDSISELKATLAKGREADEIAKKQALAEAAAPPAPEPATPLVIAEDAPKNKKRRKRKKRKTGATKRPTRSLYGSGRVVEPELVPSQPRDESGAAASVPSFGKTAAPAPAAPAVSAAPGKTTDAEERARQESSRRWSVPAFGSGAVPQAATLQNGTTAPTPLGAATVEPPAPAAPPAIEPVAADESVETPRSFGGLVLLVVSLGAAIAALVFAYTAQG